MKVIKPLKQGVLYRTFEDGDRYFFVATTFTFFAFLSPVRVLSEIDMWKFVAAELGQNSILDMGMPKPKGELLVIGKFFSPDGKPVQGGRVRVRLAGIDKTLYVFGNRYWKRGHGGLLKMTDPEPIATVDISYENAFGGPGFALNPLGKGVSQIVDDSGQKVWPLPNVESPNSLIVSPKDKPDPASFAPIDVTWPQRAKKAGTFDKKWLNTRFPGLAEDLDWTFYNMAPADQHIEGFFKGDEPFVIEGMHPEKQTLSGRLPSVRSRCFVNKIINGETLFEEIPLRPDTIWLFPHSERGILIFRGLMEVHSDDAEEILHMLVAYERLEDEDRPIDHYRQALHKRLDKEKGHLFSLSESDLIPPGEKSGFSEIMEADDTKLLVGDKLLAANMKKKGELEREKIRTRIKEAGLDPDQYAPVPPDEGEVDFEKLEDVATLAEKSQRDAEEKAKKLLAEQGFDYEQLKKEAGAKPVPRQRFQKDELLKQLEQQGRLTPEVEEKLDQAEQLIHKVYKDYGHHLPPALFPPEETLARLREEVLTEFSEGKSLRGRELIGVDLSGLDLHGIDLRDAFLEGADLSGANLEGADLRGAILVRANLSDAKLSSAKMQSCGLGKADLTRADLHGADLSEATFVGADLSGTNLSEANLAGADLSQAKLDGANMNSAIMKKCRFFETTAAGAGFVKADASESFFFNADLKGCDFTGADLTSATFVGVEADESIFRDAQLSNIRILKNSSFQAVDFSRATITKANLRGTDLSRCNFEGADISESDLSECKLSDSNFHRSVAIGTQFVKADLSNAHMVAINLFKGSLQKANLQNADLRESNLAMVDFIKVKFNNTNVGNAYLAKTFIDRWVTK